MAEITMDALRDASRRILAGQTTIEAEGTTYTIAEMAATLRQTRAQLQRIADTWTQAQLQARPPAGSASDVGEDSWSATEAISHLLATQNWYRLHMDRLLGRRRTFDIMVRGLGDQARNDIPKETLSTHLREETATFLDEIAAIPPDADLTTQRDSTYFGLLSLRGWIFLALNHDILHLAQIERIAGYPTYPTA